MQKKITLLGKLAYLERNREHANLVHKFNYSIEHKHTHRPAHRMTRQSKQLSKKGNIPRNTFEIEIQFDFISNNALFTISPSRNIINTIIC